MYLCAVACINVPGSSLIGTSSLCWEGSRTESGRFRRRYRVKRQLFFCDGDKGRCQLLHATKATSSSSWIVSYAQYTPPTRRNSTVVSFVASASAVCIGHYKPFEYEEIEDVMDFVQQFRIYSCFSYKLQFFLANRGQITLAHRQQREKWTEENDILDNTFVSLLGV